MVSPPVSAAFSYKTFAEKRQEYRKRQRNREGECKIVRVRKRWDVLHNRPFPSFQEADMLKNDKEEKGYVVWCPCTEKVGRNSEHSGDS